MKRAGTPEEGQRRRHRAVVAIACAVLVATATVSLQAWQTSPAVGAPLAGSYQWPLLGPVIRGYDPPDSPYGSGHRGIDIAAALGTPIVAAESGVVAFAGKIGAGKYVSIDHPDGVRTTYSWLGQIDVGRGQAVQRGDVIGLSGEGHTGAAITHLHFGARLQGEYVDPWLLLASFDLSTIMRLAPTRTA